MKTAFLLFSLSLGSLHALDLSFAEEGDAPSRERLAEIQGAPAIPISLDNWINSEPLELEKLKGKIVVLDFWATWCGPCIAGIPKLNAMAEKYAADVVFIGICHPRGAEKMADTVTAKGIAYPVAVDTDSEAIMAYKVNGFPDYHIIDREGKVVLADCANAKVEEVIQKLLEAE
jgi:cytochrome c biogenesis protein CcmG, thiol:disulfide interchange protein DsbE